ncbi:alpha/beta hydrolase [Intrasporangium sp. YIM S08009]|uniref:alpha/beta hydrolase n=1 Tax=Intrasporangium zincisolvens TaxID=3080018 RepID=UPI002B05E954|nr:alpha/beta hydrolase [Intrasporangium sp. YIM S08009]
MAGRAGGTVGRVAGAVVAVVGAVVGAVVAASRVSPWPSVLVIRALFDAGARRADAALAARATTGVTGVTGVTEVRDEPYLADDPDARLDVHRPSDASGPLPTVVWVHGGAFVSGSKDLIASYLKIIAAQGFTVVGVDYSIAPEARYPMPVRQTAAALDHVLREADRLGVDPTRIVLAGDSAGSQVVAQVACLTTDADYADALGIRTSLPPDHLRGLLLYCGAFDFDLARGSTPLGSWLVRTALWAYSGRRDARSDPSFMLGSVPQHVGPGFPPAFVSAGNADPLLPHSLGLVEALERLGLDVDTLFFPADHEPRLAHEYQFDLDGDAGRLALERAVAFLRRVTA